MQPESRSNDSFTREEFEKAPKRLLRDGRSANAVVWRVELAGREWTVKDFSGRNWIVRNLFAPYLIGRELGAFRRLAGIDGIAEHAFRIDRHAIAIEFQEGQATDKADPARITNEYLEQLENLMNEMHARGVVHLDVRGEGNVLIRPDGRPAIIDFQAAVFTEGLPKFLRSTLEEIDLSGAWKKWVKYRPDDLGEERRARLDRINHIRKFWVLHGYFGLKKKG
ncbi:hypothetical protein [Sutterella sp.]|uniref:hypothetical protein n=1 Tax=Sutterella sp. TaxID=1981025 RepID=UPI0026DF11F9|nr:hypothetical protein [Sutterella sp.]MDO5530998.1 hypothetical protein [Sutterella sp.]